MEPIAIQTSLPTKKGFWSGFWQLADPKVWVASTIPMAVGTFLAVKRAGGLRLGWALLALAGIYLIEIGKNALNEWVDYRSGVDLYVEARDRTPFSGGKKTLVDGVLTVRQVQWIGWATIAAGAAVGGVVVWMQAPAVLFVGLGGLFLAAAYSAPPFQLVYRGLGEVAVGAAFGPLLTAGAYAVQTGRLDAEAFWVGLPLGLLIANVLWINEFPDYEADKRGGKRTGVVRLGREQAVWVFGGLYALAYASLLALALTLKQPLWLLGWASLPLAARSVAIARRAYDQTPRLIKANALCVGVFVLSGAGMIAAAAAFA